MAIEFSGADSMRVQFSPVTQCDNLTTLTCMAWIYADTIDEGDGSGNIVINKYNGWALFTYNGAPWLNRIKFYTDNVTTAGSWVSTNNNIVATSSWYHIAAAIDRSNLASDATLYSNGVSLAVTEAQTPVGAASDDSLTGGWLMIGGIMAGNEFDGKICDVRIYNRILATGEILDIYNARGVDENYNGLIFRVRFLGAAGLQTFDGETLVTSTNYVYDDMYGSAGNPAINPTGRGDTILTVNW